MGKAYGMGRVGDVSVGKRAKKGRKNLRYLQWPDCKVCPFPHLRSGRLCSLCATLCEEEDGRRVFHERPILEEAG